MVDPSHPVLQVRNLCFTYPGEPLLFSQWSMQASSGITWLRGDTGSGKSTLIRLLAGRQSVDGHIDLHGVRLDQDPVAYRRQVFWHDPDDESFDAMKPGDIATALRTEHPGWNDTAWQRHLEGFSLMPHLGKPMYALSTGSRRKVWLSAALSAGSTLTLLDEPTGGLDKASIEHLHQALTARAADRDAATLIASGAALDAVPVSGVVDLSADRIRS